MFIVSKHLGINATSTMNEKKLVQNFKSYINVSPKNYGEKNGAIQDLKPKLLNGEAVAGSAHSVALLTPMSEANVGKIGSLFVTNYKLTFIPVIRTPADEPFQKNLLLGVYDVPLSSVESIYLTDARSSRRRGLLLYDKMPNKVKGLQVVCKNMKVLTFSFENSPMGQGRTIAMALVHHAYPKRHDLLFAYEHKEPYYPTLPPDLNMFLRPNDWKRELERCECPHWRISCINGTTEAFMLSAGETLIVPSLVVDYTLTETARHFRSGRIPVWVWGRPEGAALLRSGELDTTTVSAGPDDPASIYIEHVRRYHPNHKLELIYLCGQTGLATNSKPALPVYTYLPSLPALQASYKKLLELCTPTSTGGFFVQDSQYYSALENCKWLRYVSNALTFANTAADKLSANCGVLLLEGDGVDYCAVVSSLTQILMDPHFRTITGFQSLVQKEWVALGHPFCDRLGLLEPPKQKDQPLPSPQPAPVFLLFLDCVWQLQCQFPTEFQFTETYLTTLWDCCHNQLFDTFLFNCPRDRELAVAKNFVLRPVWDWGEQFSEQDMALFYNPLFVANRPAAPVPKQRLSHASITSSRHVLNAELTGRLQPNSSLPNMEVWSQCYERWLLPLDGLGTGPVQYLIFNMAVMKDIHKLKEMQLSLNIMSRQSNGETEKLEPVKRQSVPRFYPFSSIQAKTTAANLDSMHASLIDPSQLLDSQSLLNAPD